MEGEFNGFSVAGFLNLFLCAPNNNNEDFTSKGASDFDKYQVPEIKEAPEYEEDQLSPTPQDH